MYDLSGGLGENSAVQPGTNILISGSDETSRNCILETLADGMQNGEGAVVVTTDSSATAILEALEQRGAFDSQLLTIVDCSGGETRDWKAADTDTATDDRSTADTTGTDERTTLADGVFVYRAAAPTELTAIGVGVVECFDQLSQRGVDRCRVGLLSLSTMLEQRNESEIFKFSHVVSSRLDSAGFLGLFAINDDEADTHSYQIIREAFDETVEL